MPTTALASSYSDRCSGKSITITLERPLLRSFRALSALAAGEIVHDDDVVLVHFRDQHRADVGFKGIAVDGTVKHEGRGDAGVAQTHDEGGGLPVAKEDARAQPLAHRRPAIAPRHVGGAPGLIDEDQVRGIKIELVVELRFAPLADIWPLSLGGVGCLF